MSSHPSAKRRQAFTLVEMLVVIAIIAILAAVLLPAFSEAQAEGRRIKCVNNLKEQGTAFHAYLHDHASRFPMQVPLAEGGSREYVDNAYLINAPFYFSFRHFQPLSKDLLRTELLACPADKHRLPALNFDTLRNDNLSYFVGVKAEYDKPDSILAGDRNITNDMMLPSSIVHLDSVRRLRWTEEMHRLKGDLLFSDGHVEERTTAQLDTFRGSGVANQDLFLPTIQPVMLAGGGGLPGSGGNAGSMPTAPSPGGWRERPFVPAPDRSLMKYIEPSAPPAPALPPVELQSAPANDPPPATEQPAAPSLPDLPPVTATATPSPPSASWDLSWLLAFIVFLVIVLAAALYSRRHHHWRR